MTQTIVMNRVPTRESAVAPRRFALRVMGKSLFSKVLLGAVYKLRNPIFDLFSIPLRVKLRLQCAYMTSKKATPVYNAHT